MNKGREECWRGACTKPVVASAKIKFKDKTLGTREIEFRGCVEHFAHNWSESSHSIKNFTERAIENYKESPCTP